MSSHYGPCSWNCNCNMRIDTSAEAFGEIKFDSFNWDFDQESRITNSSMDMQESDPSHNFVVNVDEAMVDWSQFSIEGSWQSFDPSANLINPLSGYNNEILYRFHNPSLPLQILDRFLGPFVPQLQVLLEEGLQNEGQEALILEQYSGSRFGLQEIGSLYPESVKKCQLNSLGSQTLNQEMVEYSQAQITENSPQNREVRSNSRNENIRNFKASDFYRPRPGPLDNWGLVSPDQEDHLFQYTEDGELKPHLVYTAEEIWRFLSCHPLHSVYHCNEGYKIDPNRHNTKESGLTLWVQSCPADSKARYSHPQSHKCRFAKCSLETRTISPGQYRVAFDERAILGQPYDPFHVAGYVHLFCLEKYLDFPQLCRDFNVRPDDRELLEGKNKMAITRDYDSLKDIMNSFMVTPNPCNFSQRPDEYSLTLTYALTKEYLRRQSKHMQPIRTRRGGNTIDKHLNNLDVFAEGERNRNEQRARARRNRIN